MHNFLSILNELFSYQPLPELMQGVGGAIITLQISFAIGILMELFKGQKEPEGDLNLRVMLDYVWKFKQTVFATIFVFFLPFLFAYQNVEFRLLIFILWLVSFCFLILPLFDLYDWVKGNRDNAKLKYFAWTVNGSSTYGDLWQKITKEINSHSFRDKIESWKSLWQKKSISAFMDKEFFDLFSQEIDQAFIENNAKGLTLVEALISDFTENLEKRDLLFIAGFDNFFPKILNWHLWLWRQEYSKFAKDIGPLGDNSKKASSYITIGLGLNKIIKFVTAKSLSNRFSFSYFQYLKDHFTKYKNEVVVGGQHEYIYIQHIPIYRDILENIPDSDESYDIWSHYFPISWKITSENFKENIETRIWFSEFIEWANSRIWQKVESNWDKKLDEVSKELFPSVSPSLWARVLIFVLSPWSGSKIENIIKFQRNFGFIGRVMTGWGDEHEVEKKFQTSLIEEEEETIKLTLLLFGSFFTSKKIDQYMRELETLNYPTDSKEQKEKSLWINFLNKINDHLVKK